MEVNSYMRPTVVQHQQDYISQYVPIDFDQYTKKLAYADLQYKKGLKSKSEVAKSLDINPIDEGYAYGAKVQFKDPEYAEALTKYTQDKMNSILAPYKTPSGSVDYGKANIISNLKALGEEIKSHPIYNALKERRERYNLIAEKQSEKSDAPYGINPHDDAILAMKDANILNEHGGTNQFNPSATLDKFDRTPYISDQAKHIVASTLNIGHKDVGQWTEQHKTDGVTRNKVLSSVKGFIQNDPKLQQHFTEDAKRKVASEALSRGEDPHAAVLNPDLVNKKKHELMDTEMETAMNTFSYSKKDLGLHKNESFFNTAGGGNAAGAEVPLGTTMEGTQLEYMKDIHNATELTNTTKGLATSVATLESDLAKEGAGMTPNQRDILQRDKYSALDKMKEQLSYYQGVHRLNLAAVDDKTDNLYNKFKSENPGVKMTKDEFKNGIASMSLGDSHTAISNAVAAGQHSRFSEEKFNGSNPYIKKFIANNGGAIEDFRNSFKQAAAVNLNKAKSETPLRYSFSTKEGPKVINPVGTAIKNVITNPQDLNAEELDAAGNSPVKTLDENGNPNTYRDKLNQGWKVDEDSRSEIVKGAGRTLIKFNIYDPNVKTDEKTGEPLTEAHRTVTLELKGNNQVAFDKTIHQGVNHMIRSSAKGQFDSEQLAGAKKFASQMGNTELLNKLSNYNERSKGFTIDHNEGPGTPNIKIRKILSEQSKSGSKYTVEYNGQQFVANTPAEIADIYTDIKNR